MPPTRGPTGREGERGQSVTPALSALPAHGAQSVTRRFCADCESRVTDSVNPRNAGLHARWIVVRTARLTTVPGFNNTRGIGLYCVLIHHTIRICIIHALIHLLKTLPCQPYRVLYVLYLYCVLIRIMYC